MKLENNIHAQAREYLQAGLSVIPIRNDGTKAPFLQSGHPVLRRLRKATQEELERWFGWHSIPMGNEARKSQDAKGLAILCGAVSGSLAVLDFDDPDCYGPFEDQAGTLIMGFPKVHTPKRSSSGNPGVHLYACVEGLIPRTEVLARLPDGAVRIEVRGEGSYCVAPPSNGTCHRTGRPWVLAEGSPEISETLKITMGDWVTLVTIARRFNTLRYSAISIRNRIRHSQEEKRLSLQFNPDRKKTSNRTGNLLVEDYNRNADVREILRQSGAALVRKSSSGTEYWRRPNARHENGIDATFGYKGQPFLHVFSTSWTPFETMRSYSPFEVYAILKHGGDFSAALRELALKGYGSNGKK